MLNLAELKQRSGTKCELCSADDAGVAYSVPSSEGQGDAEILLCAVCESQISSATDSLDHQHWRSLNDSMWSAVPAVQVMAWRLLKRLEAESWAQDLFEMLYLDDALLEWAQAGVEDEGAIIIHKDSNGSVLSAGDTVTIIKDLNVKGTSFVAKRGTAVRGISLTDNPEHIEGRVNGTRIVILTCYVKKS